MPRDMCDVPFPPAATLVVLPKELVVFDYEDNLVLAHETLGLRLPARLDSSNWMMRGVADEACPTSDFQALFAQNLRTGLKAF